MNFKTIKKNTIYEETEKRSRFISYSFWVSSQEEVNTYLDEIKQQHPTAKHHVYAYILHNQTERYSDNGEPAGTAGMPILNAIKSMELKNVLVVIVRYFGGILLGTSGLRQMYYSGAFNVLERSGNADMFYCTHINLNLDYKQYGKVISVLSAYSTKILNTVYGQTINLDFYIDKSNYPSFYKNIIGIIKDEQKLKYLGERYQSLEKAENK